MNRSVNGIGLNILTPMPYSSLLLSISSSCLRGLFNTTLSTRNIESILPFQWSLTSCTQYPFQLSNSFMLVAKTANKPPTNQNRRDFKACQISPLGASSSCIFQSHWVMKVRFENLQYSTMGTWGPTTQISNQIDEAHCRNIGSWNADIWDLLSRWQPMTWQGAYPNEYLEFGGTILRGLE